jgi:hypothetical protein
MTYQELENELKLILKRNYAALGFELLELRITEEGYETYLRGMILCPCGATEYFAALLDPSKIEYDAAYLQYLAKVTLQDTTSITHLRKDVEEGLLPALDIDKHAFKGVLL